MDQKCKRAIKILEQFDRLARKLKARLSAKRLARLKELRYLPAWSLDGMDLTPCGCGVVRSLRRLPETPTPLRSSKKCLRTPAFQKMSTFRLHLCHSI